MRRFRLIVILSILLSTTRFAFAITLDECVTRSLGNSKLVGAYKNQIKADINAYRKELSGLLPQTTGTIETDRMLYNRKSDLEHTHGYQGKIGAGLSLDLQKIISFYPQIAHLEIEKSRYLEAIARHEIKKEVTQDYYKLYVLLKRKRDYESANRYFADHIKDIEKLQSSGVDLKLDLVRARVQQKSLFISISNINSEIYNVLISLGSRMESDLKETDFSSMSEPDLARVQTKQAIFDETAPVEGNEGSDIERIERNYSKKLTDLYQTKLDGMDLRLAKEAYRQSKFYFLPNFEYGVERNIRVVDPNTEEFRMYFGFTMNIFDFPKKAFESKELKYKYESQKNIFQEDQRKLKVQIDQLITEIEAVLITYKNAAENSASAAENIETAKSYYQQGKIRETDLLNIFTEYLSAHEQSYEAMYNYLSKKADLDFFLEGVDL